MTDFDKDKLKEKQRYSKRSSNALSAGGVFEPKFGSGTIPVLFQDPYIQYEQFLKDLIKSDHRVLELGSGSGLHTKALLDSGAEVTATDIAPPSLEILSKGLEKFGEKLTTKVADMEALPFEDGSFDIIASAGSLSYGDPEIVNREICRVLKSGGYFICVDSLNHNPIYRINRYVHYLMNRRTRSTLERIPDMKRISSFKELFENVEVQFFGSLTWAAPLFRPILGMKRTAQFFESFDKAIGVRRSAFKFVLVGRKKPIYG